MHFESGSTRELSGELFKRICAYRHRVFVETLKWNLPTRDGMELDQFDVAETVYVVCHDDEGHLTGVARLLPTTRPYLLRDVFPQLLNGFAPPCSLDVWELSRFVAMGFGNRATTALGQVSSPITIGLLRVAIACATARGAKRLITVSPLGVERLMRRAGFHSRRAGPPMIIDGRLLCACWIEPSADAANDDAAAVPQWRTPDNRIPLNG